MTVSEMIFWFGYLSVVAIIVLAAFDFGVRRPRLRKLVQIAGCLAILPVLFFALMMIFFRDAYPTKDMYARSPDNRYVTKTSSSPGGVFADRIVTVSIRRAWSPFAEEVYFGSAEPQMQWLDGRTLSFTYTQLESWTPRCSGSKVGVRVLCKFVPK